MGRNHTVARSARWVFPGFMLVMLLAVNGCVSSTGISVTVYEVGDVNSTSQFIAYLEDMGYDLEPVELLNSAPIPNTQAGNIYSIRVKEMDDYILFFEHHEAERAHYEARRLDVGYLPEIRAHSRARLRPAHDLGTHIPLGRRPPVFQYENFVVIHYGHNASITTTLARVFGRNVTR